MVSLSMLRIIQIIPCDVYIKLNNDKFVKVHSKGDQISDEDIHNYNKKKIPKLIIEKEDVKHFLNSVCNKISSMLLEDKKTVKEEKILDVHAFIMDAASSIGFNDQLIRATSKSVEYAVDVFKKNEKYKDVFQHIFGHKGKYLTRHSIALAYISCGIISKLPWNSDETRRKLVLASFLHDAFVKRSEFDEGEFEDGQPESIDSFYGQPQETIKILNKMHDIPMDVDRIILEHLEKPDGSGKRQLTASQLHPLSCVFILSHEIVDHIFHLEFHKQDITDEKIKELIKN